MDMLTWNILIVVSKCLFYLGFASTFGLYFSRFLFVQDSATIATGSHGNSLFAVASCSLAPLALLLIPALITALAAIFWFLFNTGAMAEEGLVGMFDPLMLDILWTSSVGDATLFRVLGMFAFIALQVFSYYRLERSSGNITKKVVNGLSIGCLFFVSNSFAQTGHITELNWLAKVLIVFHVSVMAWWFGLLWPLRKACLVLPPALLQALMVRFGKQASVLIPLLLLAGGGLGYLLVGSFEALFSRSYGQVLLLKLIGVVIILSIAALHKVCFVPTILSSKNGTRRLSRSIGFEIFIGILILTLCSILTSLVGPTE